MRFPFVSTQINPLGSLPARWAPEENCSLFQLTSGHPRMIIKRKPRDRWPACISCGRSTFPHGQLEYCQECRAIYCGECVVERSRQVGSHRLVKSKHCPQCGAMGPGKLAIHELAGPPSGRMHAITNEILETTSYTDEERRLRDESFNARKEHRDRVYQYKHKRWWQYWIKPAGPEPESPTFEKSYEEL